IPRADSAGRYCRTRNRVDGTIAPAVKATTRTVRYLRGDLAAAHTVLYGRAIDELTEPQLQDQQGPQAIDVRAVAIQSLDQPGNVGRLKEPARPCGVIQQQISDHRAEVVTHPVLQRDAKALLRAVQDLRGHQVAHGTTQKILATHTHQQVGGQARGKLHDVGVEKGTSHLQRVRHGCDVDLYVDVVHEIGLKIQVRNPADGRGRGALGEQLPKALERRLGARGVHHLGVQSVLL